MDWNKIWNSVTDFFTNNFWNISYKDFFERMESTAKKQGFYLSDEQSEVVRSITENKFYVDKTLPIKLMCDTRTYKFNKKNRRQKVRNEEFVFVNANCDSCYLDAENINMALDVFCGLGMDEIDLVLYKNKNHNIHYRQRQP